MNTLFRSIILVIIFISITVLPLAAEGSAEEIENPDLIVKIDGMTCTLCSDSVIKSFGSNPEIQSVSADHKTGTAYVRLADPSADIDKLTDFFDSSLTDLGYSLISVTQKETQ